MRLSELIREASEVMDLLGDVDVTMITNGNTAKMAVAHGFALGANEKGVRNVALCDAQTIEEMNKRIANTPQPAAWDEGMR